jgi:hypothetical protein
MTVRALDPEGVGAVYRVADRPELGPRRPDNRRRYLPTGPRYLSSQSRVSLMYSVRGGM